MKEKLTELELKLHRRFSDLGMNYKKMQYSLLRLLPEIERLGYFKKLGFVSVHDYAVQVAGLSISSVKRVQKLDKKLLNFPKLRAAIDEVGINKVEIVSRIVDEENQEIWIDNVKTMTKRVLERSVKKALIDKGVKVRSFNKKLKVGFSLEAEKVFWRLKKKFKLQGSNKLVLERILKNFEEALNGGDLVVSEALGASIVNENVLCDGESEVFVGEDDLNVHTGGNVFDDSADEQSRYIPVERRHALFLRSKGSCECSGCTFAAQVIHHVDRFALYKNHDRIVHLCNECHEMVHNGMIENEQDPPGEWRLVQNEKKLSFIDRKFQKKRAEIRVLDG